MDLASSFKENPKEMNRSSQPSAWRALSLYESRDFVVRRFKDRHNRQCNAGKASEIIAAIAQGRQYFEEAQTAGDLVRPLLLYYGVLSLSRSLVLLANPVARETSLAPGHGLSISGWKETLSGGISKIGDLLVQGGDHGTFAELSSVTENREVAIVYFGPFPSFFTLQRTYAMKPGEVKVTVKELVARIPQVARLYERIYGEAYCFPAIVFTLKSAWQTDLLIHGFGSTLPAQEHVMKALGLSPESLQKVASEHHFFGGPQEHYHFRLAPGSEDELVAILPPMALDEDHKTYLVAPLDAGGPLSPLLLLYLCSYALGMLVRYFPASWWSLGSRTPGDAMLPLLRHATDLIQTRFPVLILEEVEHDPLTAITPTPSPP